VIELSSVSVVLGGQRVVDELSASVADGEWVAVIGPNGAGKTTLLRAIAGLVPFTGTITLDGRPVTSLDRRELARSVALVPQIPALPVELTVSDYVLLGRTPYVSYLGKESRHDVEAAERALLRMDLAHLAARRLGTLSGGEWQRAVLARALAQEAPVLLLDEPTSALDVGRIQKALALVDGLRTDEGLTVLSAMHDLTLAGQFADRLLLLSRGCLVASGPAREVLTEALVAEHYEAAVRILDEEGVGIAVVPRR
jgi:iron complex transport system ATP-binding protein